MGNRRRRSSSRATQRTRSLPAPVDDAPVLHGVAGGNRIVERQQQRRLLEARPGQQALRRERALLASGAGSRPRAGSSAPRSRSRSSPCWPARRSAVAFVHPRRRAGPLLRSRGPHASPRGRRGRALSRAAGAAGSARRSDAGSRAYLVVQGLEAPRHGRGRVALEGERPARPCPSLASGPGRRAARARRPPARAGRPKGRADRFAPSRTASRTAPTSLATTGSAASMASTTASGKPSKREGRTKTSNDSRCLLGSSDQPTKCTRSATPSSPASRSRRARSLPSPTNTASSTGQAR